MIANNLNWYGENQKKTLLVFYVLEFSYNNGYKLISILEFAA